MPEGLFLRLSLVKRREENCFPKNISVPQQIAVEVEYK
jgi:hypothetical protein